MKKVSINTSVFVAPLLSLFSIAHADTAFTVTTAITVDTRDASVQKIGAITQRSPENGGGVGVSWASMAGQFYNMERSYDLKNWVVISENTAATPPQNTLVDAAAPPSGKAFYRLVILESP